MTVRELIQVLKKVNGDRLVVVSRDSEGNGFSPLEALRKAAYDADTMEVGLERLTKSDRKYGYTEEDVLEHGVPALVLWPTHG